MRFAIIGDVHGHATEFMILLRKLEAHGVDRIFQVGDLVDRGPASVECVRLARTWRFVARDGSERGIECILGNHEDNHLHAHYQRVLPHKGIVPKTRHPDVTEGLTEADYEWLDSLPLYLDLKLDGMRVGIVHGGLPPGTKMPHWHGRLKASKFLRTGFLDETGEPLSSWHTSDRFWADEYTGTYGHIFFGHTSFDRIRHFPYATGVDCSKRGKLAAIVVSTEKEMPREYYVSLPEPPKGYKASKSAPRPRRGSQSVLFDMVSDDRDSDDTPWYKRPARPKFHDKTDDEFEDEERSAGAGGGEEALDEDLEIRPY